MSIQPSEALVVESNSDGKWFSGIRDDVHSDDDDDGLTEQRLKQWRPFLQSPFNDSDAGVTPQTLVSNVGGDDEKDLEKPGMSRADTSLSQQNSVSNPVQVVYAGPAWVHLDTISYLVFFLVVWWLWASQTLYNIHFYTNDWVHLLSIFVQLIIFGVLAATARGYNVGAYIVRSDEPDTLDARTINDIYEPEYYVKDRKAFYSLDAIGFSLAASRTIQWLQHVFVLVQAWFTARKLKRHIPWKLYILPFGLLISIGLFWTAAVFTHFKGRTVSGAWLKFILWAVGLLVELLLHLLMENCKWEVDSFRCLKESITSHDVPPQLELLRAPSQSPQPSPVQRNQAWPVHLSGVNLRERLEAITTIILGEGLNTIAGALGAGISAPGLGSAVVVNIFCAALIVYLLAYFYFEGPTGDRNLKGSNRRQMEWMLSHFPFLLSIILLLLGIKNQFLLTSYLSTGERTFRKLGETMDGQRLALDDPTSELNMPMKNFLLKRGLKWAEEFQALNASVTQSGTIPLGDVSDEQYEEDFGIWSMRISLKVMVNLYKAFMGEDSEIKPELEAWIQMYYDDDDYPLLDVVGELEQASEFNYPRIISGLLENNLQISRYIIGLAGVIFLSLGLMNRLHSKPRDRFQWGIILSRLSMGFILLLLLNLNCGEIQSLWIREGQEKQQAGVFRWVWAWMVVPTIAIAFAVEFVIEWTLIRCAGMATARKRGDFSGPLWREFFGIRMPFKLNWFGRAK
ncbi:unnamed protein product [Rhizoctonia solani]|uniref:Uncharacterized protein n=1 Tax=Rhizoctonia solani TaxID=456999 RepID=A0A8H3A5S0_9AGAM|nr:unnamed protein product [Rhizoctonia solani]